jgi:hypothetical protein
VLGQASHHLPGRHLFVLVRLSDVRDLAPLLAADVEQASHLPRQEAIITGQDIPQRGQQAGDLVQGGLIDDHHLCCEGGQGGAGIGRQALPQHSADLLEECLQCGGPLSREPLVDRLIAHEEAGIEPEAALGQEPPQGHLVGEPLEDTDQQGAPQTERRQDARPPRLGWAGFTRVGL